MPVKFLKGESSPDLKSKENPKPALKDGQIIFTTDDRRLYIDHRTIPADDTSVVRLAVAAGGATFFVSELLTKNGVEVVNGYVTYPVDCKSVLEEDRNYRFTIEYEPEADTDADNFKYRCDIMKANFNAKLEDREIKITTSKTDIIDNTIRANILLWEIEKEEVQEI